MTTVEQIWAATREQKLVEDRIRRQPPLVRLWDAEWNCQIVLGCEYGAQFAWVSNDTGVGQVEIPFDTAAAQWIYDHQARLDAGQGRTVGITVDYCGARWSGIMDKFSVEQRDDGDVVLTVAFVHDYEHLKWLLVRCNPFLPDAIQIPRAWILAGPTTWICKVTLICAIWYEYNPMLTWPDDPLDISNWLSMGLDLSDWHMVVKPESFLEAMASGVVWGIITGRYDNFHDVTHAMLEDAELSWVCRRYLEGDDPPWDGADLRYGTLVFDIVDKSGILVGTSHGGNIFDGLVRTVVEFADDFVDSTLELVADAETPTDYFLPGSRYTHPEKPYVIFREGETSQIQTSSWIYSPSKGIRVTVGGHSMPGVNETISATIQAVGDILGNLIQLGSLGGTIDSLLAPLYEDTLLAWSSILSPQRRDNAGWDHLTDYFQDGANNAWTLAALMVIRAGYWATKTVISWKVDIVEGPYLIGDNGLGHFFLDDRVGLILKGDNTIHMDRCRRLDLAWGPTDPPTWTINIGDERIWQDPAQRAMARIERLIAALHNVGVW